MDAAILTEELGWHRTGWAIRLGHSDSVGKVFLSDPSGKNADLVSQAVGDKLGGVYSSPAELLEEHKIQMAVVTMAPSRMPDAVLAALEAGAHVLVEKPGATSPDAYAPLVELANARGLLLTMALMADSPVVREAARIVSEGTLGRIYGINYLSMDHQRWRRRHDFGWVFSRAQAGGGILGHLACHYLHSMRRMLGEEVVEVTGFADVVCGEPLEVEDTILLCVRFAGGAVGVLHSGYWGPTPYQPVETEVQSISPAGTLIMSDSVKPALLPKTRAPRSHAASGCGVKRAAFPQTPTAGTSHSTFKPTSRAVPGIWANPRTGTSSNAGRPISATQWNPKVRTLSFKPSSMPSVERVIRPTPTRTVCASWRFNTPCTAPPIQAEYSALQAVDPRTRHMGWLVPSGYGVFSEKERWSTSRTPRRPAARAARATYRSVPHYPI